MPKAEAEDGVDTKKRKIEEKSEEGLDAISKQYSSADQT
jgi:hypothetical protein